MSKYSLKFTTIKEWKPELLSPDENPDNPICLIINESQEAIAMLVPHVDNTFNESFIFHSESDTKTFKTIVEACEYVGLSEENKECSQFLTNTEHFILTEKARLERLNPFYDGIHTPYNDALQLYELRNSYSEEKEALFEDLITGRTNLFEPSESFDSAAPKIFKICKKHQGINILIFNNQAYFDALIEKSDFALLKENFQCKLNLSEIFGVGRNNSGEIEKLFNKDKIEKEYLPLFVENAGSLGVKNRTVTVFDNTTGLTIEIILKNKTIDAVSPKELSINNLETGYSLIYTKNSDIKYKDIYFNESNNEYNTIAKIKSVISENSHSYTFSKIEDGEGSSCELNNGITAVLSETRNNSQALTLYKGKEIINIGNEPSEASKLMKKGLPPISMRLNEPTIMNILHSVEGMTFKTKPEVDINQFYNEERFDKLFDDEHNTATIKFSKNDYMATFTKLEDGSFYMRLSSQKSPEVTIEDQMFSQEEKSDMLEILNQYISMRSIDNTVININSSSNDLTENDVFVKNSLPLTINITGKKPHNITAIVKFIGKDSEHKSKYSITVREQSNFSKNKEDTYYDTSVENIIGSGRYPSLEQYIIEKNFKFPTTDKKQIIDCLNFIKNNDIGTTSRSINNILNSEGNKDKDIRYIYPTDVPLTAKDIFNDFKDKNEGDSVYYVFARKVQLAGRLNPQDIKSSDIYDSVIVVTLTNKKENKFSYDYNQYSEKDDTELGYKPFELKPIFKTNKETGKLEVSSHLHTDQTIDNLVDKFEKTQREVLIKR